MSSENYEAWYREVPWESLTIRDFEMLTTELAHQTRLLADDYWSASGLEGISREQFSGVRPSLQKKLSKMFLTAQLSADLLGAPVQGVSVIPRPDRLSSFIDVSVFTEGYRSQQAGRIIVTLLQQILYASDEYLKKRGQPKNVFYSDMADALAIEVFEGVALESDFQLRYDVLEFSLFYRRLITRIVGREGGWRFPYELTQHVIDTCYMGKIHQTEAQREQEYRQAQERLEANREYYEIWQAFARGETTHGNKGLMSRQPDEGAPPKKIGKI